MRAPHFGHEPGMATPEAAAGDQSAGSASVDADTGPAAGLTTQKESALAAQAAQSRVQNEHPDSASDEASSKAFRTLRAELAMIGYGLQRAVWGGYLITRWNLSREEAALDGVEQFLRRVKR